MYKQFFAHMELTALPMFAMALFIGIFGLMLVRLFFWKTRGDYSASEALPLSDGQLVSQDNLATRRTEVTK